MKLLTSQKNRLYDLIAADNHFTPNQFNINENINGFYLNYIAEDFYFKIADHGSFMVTRVPSMVKYEEAIGTSSWDDVIQFFKGWLKIIQREISSPSKWERLSKEMNNIRGIVQADNTMFSHSEYMTLTQQMKEIKESLVTISLTAEQNQAIEAKLDHLLVVANDLSKFDWQGLFIGTIISIIIQLNVTPENAHALTVMMNQVFNRLFLK
jgi:hypothetical protein